jgi:hypothetical protein
MAKTLRWFAIMRSSYNEAGALGRLPVRRAAAATRRDVPTRAAARPRSARVRRHVRCSPVDRTEVHMRIVILPIAVSLLGGTVRAGSLSPIDVNAIPPACRELARVPSNARTPTVARAAHLSVASCLAEARMSTLALAHDDTSMRALTRAVAPSLAMIDEVAGDGDPGWRLMALFSKADLYEGMAVRMRVASNGDTTLEPEIKPWLDQARAAFTEVLAIARANPSLAADNVVIDSDVRASERRLAFTSTK